jgi:hypothetical protein
MKDNKNFWNIYDALIEPIPSEERIVEFAGGHHWSAVLSDGGLGLAMGPGPGTHSVTWAGGVAGNILRRAAYQSKSWNLPDACLGVASINAYHNRASLVNAWTNQMGCKYSSENIFTYLEPKFKNKKVTVVGHFHGLEKYKSICDLTILERNPHDSDTPDPACELIIPESDIVVMTATTLINKTMPRLLELAKDAYVAIAGPTTPLWKGWFDMGVNLIAGVIVEDEDAVFQRVQEGGSHTFFGNGAKMVTYERP